MGVHVCNYRTHLWYHGAKNPDLSLQVYIWLNACDCFNGPKRMSVDACKTILKFSNPHSFYSLAHMTPFGTIMQLGQHISLLPDIHQVLCTSYQIRKIARCACAGNTGNVSPATNFKETASLRSRHPSRHVRHARAVMHVGIANPRWRGKRSRHSRRMHNPQRYVSGKKPIVLYMPLSTRWLNISCGSRCCSVNLFHGLSFPVPVMNLPWNVVLWYAHGSNFTRDAQHI